MRKLDMVFQSRIDFFLISCHLEFLVRSVDIVPSIKSDHSLLTLSLVSNIDHPRGKGLWKFNSSLLYDEDYKKTGERYYQGILRGQQKP